MKLATILLAAALVSPAAVSATSLVDGSFEIKGAATAPTDYCYDGFSSAGRPACAAGAWTGSGVITSGAGPWGSTVTPFGNYYGFVQGTQVMSQTFVATSSTGLGVSWYDANRTNNGGIQTYTVSVTHGSDVFALGTFTGVPGQFNLKTSSSFATVAGDSYTLNFTGLATDDRTAFIDNVSLSVVPEPATWGLMLAGFALVGVAARRRAALTA